MPTETNQNPIIIAALNLAAKLESAVASRKLRTNTYFTARFRATQQLERRAVEIRRGVNECEQLAILNPPCADKYYAQIGEITADLYRSCLKHNPDTHPANV